MSIINPLENNKAYDFETQLELGEMLLGLGRVEDAEVELRKARELNEIGSYSTADDDPQRAAHLQRLNSALERVEAISEKTRKRSRFGWMAATIALAAVAALLGIILVFNRAEVSQTTEQSTRDAIALATESAKLNQSANLMGQENTRTVREIEDQKRVIATMQAENQRIGDLAGSNMQLATVAAENAALIQRLETSINNNSGNNSGNQAPIVITVEVETAGEQIVVTQAVAQPVSQSDDNSLGLDGLGRPQYRVLTASNVRLGPGLEYPIIIYLRRGEVVSVIAQSEDARWFNIQTPEGRLGWIHGSLLELVSLSPIPIAATLPAPPEPTTTQLVPTSVPEPTQVVEPTAVPVEPTAVPVVEEPTAVPESEQTEQSEETSESTDVPVATEVPAVDPTPEGESAVSPSEDTVQTQEEIPTEVLLDGSTVFSTETTSE